MYVAVERTITCELTESQKKARVKDAQSITVSMSGEHSRDKQ